MDGQISQLKTKQNNLRPHLARPGGEKDSVASPANLLHPRDKLVGAAVLLLYTFLADNLVHPRDKPVGVLARKMWLNLSPSAGLLPFSIWDGR